MEPKLVAVYGSLKKGFYNHGGLGQDAEYLGNMTVLGVMYSNGSYPKMYHIREPEGDAPNLFGSDRARQHEVEVYRINPERYKGITRMEEGAGYEAEDIETPYGIATMYFVPHAHFYDRDHWVEAYVKEGGLESRF